MRPLLTVGPGPDRRAPGLLGLLWQATGTLSSTELPEDQGDALERKLQVFLLEAFGTECRRQPQSLARGPGQRSLKPLTTSSPPGLKTQPGLTPSRGFPCGLPREDAGHGSHPHAHSARAPLPSPLLACVHLGPLRELHRVHARSIHHPLHGGASGPGRLCWGRQQNP